MKKRTGLWVDHRQAILVHFEGVEESVVRVASYADKHVRGAGGSRSSTAFGPQDVSADDQRDRHRMSQYNHFYDELIQLLRDSTAFFIFGPGEAKLELQARLKRHGDLKSKLTGVETTDNLTEFEIRDKIRNHFRLPARDLSS